MFRSKISERKMKNEIIFENRNLYEPRCLPFLQNDILIYITLFAYADTFKKIVNVSSTGTQTCVRVCVEEYKINVE